MDQFIRKIGNYEKFQEVKDYTLALIEENEDAIRKYSQLAIQWADEPTWNNCQGIEKGLREHEFYKLMPQLKDSPIEEFLNHLSIKTFRSRIFVVHPEGNGYHVHYDPSPRLHLPIYTNDECYFLSTDSPDGELHREPKLNADGSMYTVDTTRYHTFCNNGNEKRIHIVCGID